MGFIDTMRPFRMECDIHDLEIDGDVPEGLDGAFFRVHPDPQFPPKFEDDQFFNGDGMVSKFRFKDGKIDFKHRYIRTDKWKLENKAGRALFGSYRNPLFDDASVKGQIRGTANTNVMVHAGKLYAMKEDSPCFLVDPVTLESEGYTDFGGKLKIPTFTAHPKIDPKTGNFCGFGYATGGHLTKGVSYFEIDPKGKLVKQIDFEAPYYSMLHDFGVTEDYAVFHVVPYVSSWERLEKNLPHFAFDTTLPVYLGVLPRHGDGKDIRWFKAPAACACHVMNAFNDGAKVHIDIPVAKNSSLPFFPDAHGAPFDPVAALGYLTRWTVDMDSNSEEFHKVERLTGLADEFPRIDDRYATQPYRHGWMVVFDTQKPYEGPGGAFSTICNTLGHIDLATRKEKTWFAGPQSGIQEPCFIPRNARAEEGDGYLVALIDNHITNYSDLAVFDAQRVDEGPIARAKLPTRLRQGLHGNWAEAAAFQ
jgi:carotenoid cleavage dioxygenase